MNNVFFSKILKKIKELRFRETIIMADLQSDYFVQYKTFWIEVNKLYIQMELCYKILKDIIHIKRNELSREPFEVMKIAEFYVSCELLKEIIEGLNFLHKHEP
jgi:hypothetical protein